MIGGYIFLGVTVAIIIVASFLRSRKKNSHNEKKKDHFQNKLDQLKSEGYTITKYYLNYNRDLLFGIDEAKQTFFASKLNKGIKHFSFSNIIECKININGKLVGDTSKVPKFTENNYTGLSLTIDDLSFPKLDLTFAKKNPNQCMSSLKDLNMWHDLFHVIINRNKKS